MTPIAITTTLRPPVVQPRPVYDHCGVIAGYVLVDTSTGQRLSDPTCCAACALAARR